MTSDQRTIQRKRRILQHAERIGDVSKTCRYFGVGRASFYRWRKAYQDLGEPGLVNAKTSSKNPANQTPWEKLVKIGAKVVRHGRNVTFQRAEVAIPRRVFAEILRMIDGLRPRPAPT